MSYYSEIQQASKDMDKIIDAIIKNNMRVKLSHIILELTSNYQISAGIIKKRVALYLEVVPGLKLLDGELFFEPFNKTSNNKEVKA
jgi:hypothetical protein